jgi:hypothetical protein
MEPHTDHSQMLEPSLLRSLQLVAAQRARLDAAVLRLTVAVVVLGALATFFAGLSSLTGQPIVAADWRVTCAIASVFTLAATIVGGVQALVARPERLARASECLGKLRALALDIDAPGHDPAALRRKYQQILVEHADLDL